MSANISGAVMGAAWLGVGSLGVWFVLFRTKILDGSRGNFGLTANDLRQHFKLIVVAAVCGGAIIGWIGGPVLFGELP